jgi:hypothetical protein
MYIVSRCLHPRQRLLASINSHGIVTMYWVLLTYPFVI